MEKTEFELGADEAALIFKKDMSIEIIIPKMEDTETVDFMENQNMFVAMAIAASSDSVDFRNLIGAKLNDMLGADTEAEDGCDTESCKESGCPGCGPTLMETPPLGEEGTSVDVPKCSCGPEDCSCEEC